MTETDNQNTDQVRNRNEQIITDHVGEGTAGAQPTAADHVLATVGEPALQLERREGDPPPPPPTLSSTRADQLAQAPTGDKLLGGYLDSRFVALVGAAGSNASALALAIAEAVATGRELLGVPTVPARVLYVDQRRPPEVISSSLISEVSERENLRILSRGRETDWLRIDEELTALKYDGESPKLVVNANGLQRSRGDMVNLVLYQVPAVTVAGLHALPKGLGELAREADSIILLQAATSNSVRLMHYLYGELQADILVENSGSWRPLGNAADVVTGRRQELVLEAIAQAERDGITPPELALLLDMEKNHVYQVTFKLKGKIVKVNGKWYRPNFAPERQKTEK